MNKIFFIATILFSAYHIQCGFNQPLNGQVSDQSLEQKPLNNSVLQKQASNSQDVSQSIEDIIKNKHESVQQKSNAKLSQESLEDDLQNKSSQENLELSQKQNNEMVDQLGMSIQNKYNLQQSGFQNQKMDKSDHSEEEFLFKQNIQNYEPNQHKSKISEVHQSTEQDFWNPQDEVPGYRNPLMHTKTGQLSQEEIDELYQHQNQQKLKEQLAQGLQNQYQDLPNNKMFQKQVSWHYPVLKINSQEDQNPKVEHFQETFNPQDNPQSMLQKNTGLLKESVQHNELLTPGNNSQVIAEDKNKSQVPSSKHQEEELLRIQNYQNQQNEKSKLLKRSQSFAIKAENGNSCNKDLLLAFGVKLDDSREGDNIQPQQSGVKEKTLCRRNMGTCCSYDEMMSVADSFAVTANKLREQFIVLEELYVMFKGTKIFDVLNDLKQIDNCKAVMDSHVLIPKDQEGKSTGTFETTVAIEIQNNIAGLFNEMRRYKKHVISTYGNVVCSICSPAESKYFKLNEDKELQELDLTFANCQEIMDLKDFEIRVAEVYQKYLLPLVSVIECAKQDDDPKVDEIELDQFIEQKKQFDNCFNNYSLDNPDCQEICTGFDIKTYSFPGNFFKVSKQMLTFFFKKFANGDINEYYQDYKDKEYHSFANAESFVFYPELKVPKVEEDIYKADVKLVESRGINITNDYINRIFLEHNQHNQPNSHSTISIVLTMIMLILF